MATSPKWEYLHPDSPNTTGSSMVVINNTVYVVGGGDVQRSPYMSAFVFDLKFGNWRRAHVNSYGAPNRISHQTVAVNGKGYVCGGYIPADGLSHQHGSSELTQISSSLFGIEMRTISVNPMFSRCGHTASVVGPKSNKILFIGGKVLPASQLLSQAPLLAPPPPPKSAVPEPVEAKPTEGKDKHGKDKKGAAAAAAVDNTSAGAPAAAQDSPMINPHLFLVSLEGDKPVVQSIDIEGEGPIGAVLPNQTSPIVTNTREYHSATVFGNQNQYILVVGGKQGTSICSDVWVLDLSAVVGAHASEASVANATNAKDAGKKKDAKKGAAGGAGASAGTGSGLVAVWHKIFDASKVCEGRYLHNAIAVDQENVLVFGGIGAHPTTESDAQLQQQNKFNSNCRYILNIASIITQLNGTKNFANIDFVEEIVPMDSSLWPEQEQINALVCHSSIAGSNMISCALVEAAAEAERGSPRVVAVLTCGGSVLHQTSSSSSSSSSLRLLPVDESSDLLLSIRKSARASGFFNLSSESEEQRKRSKIPTRMEYRNGDVYEGQLIRLDADNFMNNSEDNLLRHGQGKMIYANGDLYEGEWNRNVREGQGSSVCKNGTERYTGSFVKDCYEGNGKLTITDAPSATAAAAAAASSSSSSSSSSSDVSVITVQYNNIDYQGEFFNNQFHGQGRLTDTITGQVYINSFVNHQLHGSAGRIERVFLPIEQFIKPYNLHLSVIEKYESVITDCKWENGVFVSGRAENVCINCDGKWGSGLMNLINGSNGNNGAFASMDEDYLQMISTLSVTHIFPETVSLSPTKTSKDNNNNNNSNKSNNNNISKFNAASLLNRQRQQQQQLLGLYSGWLSSKGPEDNSAACLYCDGSEFAGTFKSGRRNGVGRIIGLNNDVFEGKFVGNVRKGHGKWTSSHGDCYDGLWEDDKPSGYGVRYYQDGSSTAGTWENGVLITIDQ